MSRRIEISSRNEGGRCSKIPQMHISKLDDMFDEFNQNIMSIREKFIVSEQLQDLGNISGAEDIYRAQIVFLESALDYYMHNLGIYAMQQMYKGNWNKTDGYKDLKIPIDQVMYAIEHPEKTEWIDKAIITHHASKTYMNPTEIKGQFTLIVGKEFFDEIAKKMYYDRTSRIKPQDKLKNILKDLFDRRNKIVHQADRDHVTREKFTIEKEQVGNYIDAIELFIRTVHETLIE